MAVTDDHYRFPARGEHSTKRGGMLQNLDDQVRDCIQRAAECAELANVVSDPRKRDEWLATIWPH
jgi:hypothetical protein